MAGCWLARRLHPLKASTTMDLVFLFPYFCTICGLEKLGIVDQNWLENVFVRFVVENAGRG